MIFDAFFELVTTLINVLYAALPGWTISIATLGGVSGVNILNSSNGETTVSELSMFDVLLVWCSQYNNFVPFDHFVAAMGFVLTVVVALFAFSGARWIIGVVRGCGTGSGAGA